MEKSNTIYKSDSLLQDAQHIIEAAQNFAYKAVNIAMLQRNWLLGKRIAEEELQGKDRAEYGAEIIKNLSVELIKIYGNGFTKTNLYTFTEFYKAFPNIFHTLCGKSEENIFHSLSGKSENENFQSVIGKCLPENLDALRPKSFSLLTWSHYRTLLQVKDPEARDWYMKEAADQTWSVRTLQRNISSQYYFRLLKSHNKDRVKSEMEQKTSSYLFDRLEFIKNPVIAEFLGYAHDKGGFSMRKQLPLFRRGVGGGVSGLLRSAHNDGGVEMEGIPHFVRNDGTEKGGWESGGGGFAAATTSPANTRHSEQSEETIIN